MYVAILFKRLFLNEADSNYTMMDVLQLDDIAAFDYNKTDNTVFHVLKKQMGETPMLTEELARYIELTYE